MRGQSYFIIPLFFLTVFVVLLSACPTKVTGGYVISDGTVVYHHGLKGMYTMRSSIVEGADAASFKALDRYYGRDKNHAYFDGRRISGSEGASFRIVDSPYTADKFHVYYSGVVISDRPATFKILFKTKRNAAENTFATDGEVVFKGKHTFLPDIVDTQTFARIDKSNYFKDKRRVYTLNREIEGADPETFETNNRYGGRYSSDATSVFYNGVQVKGVDLSSHEILDNVHHRDKARVYFAMSSLSEDPENFQILSKAYSKDSRFAYWRGRKISDDAPNFVIFPSELAEAYAKDSSDAYWGWNPIKGADVRTFVGLDRHYAKDKNRVYFGVNVVNQPSEIEGADPATFALVKGERGVDARDKNGRYNFGRKSRSAH